MANPILESVSKVLVVNASDEALILTVGEYKARPDKSFKPDLPGGLVDPGETELVAVQRELAEEAGIALDFSIFQQVYSQTEFYANENKSVTKTLYIARIDETPEVKLSWEHVSHEWVPLEKLKGGEVELRAFYGDAIKYCFKNGIL